MNNAQNTNYSLFSGSASSKVKSLSITIPHDWNDILSVQNNDSVDSVKGDKVDKTDYAEYENMVSSILNSCRSASQQTWNASQQTWNASQPSNMTTVKAPKTVDSKKMYLSYIQKAFELNDVRNPVNVADLLMVAQMYLVGEIVARDVELAIKYYKSAADMNNAEAYYLLGCLYYTGKFMTKNYNIAYDYFSKAAKLGHSISYYNAGMILLDPSFENNNSLVAIIYLKSAARTGMYEAMMTLGYYYSNLFTKTKNSTYLDTAYKYYSMAYQRNCSNYGKVMLNTIKLKNTMNDINKLKRQRVIED